MTPSPGSGSSVDSIDRGGCDRCGESPGGMFYQGWVASVDGIVCHRCAEDPTQFDQPSSRSLADVFGSKPDGSSEYLELEALKDHRCCPHTSEILDENWSGVDSYSWQSSCPECDPGPTSPKNRVRRGHALVAVVTGQIEPEKTAVATETTDAGVPLVADGGEGVNDAE